MRVYTAAWVLKISFDTRKGMGVVDLFTRGAFYSPLLKTPIRAMINTWLLKLQECFTRYVYNVASSILFGILRGKTWLLWRKRLLKLIVLHLKRFSYNILLISRDVYFIEMVNYYDIAGNIWVFDSWNKAGNKKELPWWCIRNSRLPLFIQFYVLKNSIWKHRISVQTTVK